MNKEEQNLNNAENPKLAISDVIKRTYTFGGVFEGTRIKGEIKIEATGDDEAKFIFETEYPTCGYMILTSPL